MFKIIGITVFIAVIVIGYPSINRWYKGEITPSEAVNSIRGEIGIFLNPNSEKGLGLNDTTSKNDQSQEDQVTDQPTGFSTEKAARELMKHAND